MRHFRTSIATLILAAGLTMATAAQETPKPAGETPAAQSVPAPAAAQPEVKPAATAPAKAADTAKPAGAKAADPKTADAKSTTETPATVDEAESAAQGKAPERFIPTTKSKADNSATFPVDI